MEFSKKILIVLWISTTIVVFFAFLLMYKFGDLSPISVILSGLFALLTTSVGFYYWKAKSENMAKFKNLNVEEDENNENY